MASKLKIHSNQDRFSLYSLFVLIVASAGGLLFGYHFAIISGALSFIKAAFHLSAWSEGFVVSILLLGGLAGALSAGSIADKWGRKKVMLITGVIFIIGSLILTTADSYYAMLLGRFITGMSVGLTSVVTPLYLAEIAPPHYRGRFVCVFQLMITLGILLAYGINIGFAKEQQWRLMFLFGSMPAALQCIGLIFLPETPAWLMRHGEIPSALEALEDLRDDTEWKEHLPEMKKTAAPKKQGTWKLLFQSQFRYVVFIGFLLSIFQQITGINTVIFYAPKIFEMTGVVAANDALLVTFLIGVVNCLSTFISIWLLDKVGRRKLLLIGTFGISLSLMLLTFAFLSKWVLNDAIAVISVMCYVICFAMSLGPITWVILSEIYPLIIRGKAIALALFANWFFNYVVSLTFLVLLDKLGAGGTFFFYGLISLISFAFIYFCIPETKGKSLEEIEQIVTRGKFR